MLAHAYALIAREIQMLYRIYKRVPLRVSFPRPRAVWTGRWQRARTDSREAGQLPAFSPLPRSALSPIA